jgi:hypothetical protein
VSGVENKEPVEKPASENGDYLCYGVYAETLRHRIESALDKDGGDPSKLGDDPLVVGIFGEWGAGKSKLLKLILDKAEKLASQIKRARSGKDGGFGDAGFSLTVPVLFQPWKYEHEANLLVPLLLHIVQALNETARRGQTPGEDLIQKAQIAGDKAFAALPGVVKSFEFLHNNVAVDLALVADPMSAAALLKTAGWLANLKKKVSLPQTSLKKDFKFTSEGRFYYNLHQALKGVTRPGSNPTVLEDIRLPKDVRINFGIFIDDLDRCLPEKAVEALELIKTVFNLESFAFVLALDEEVVERGIGHRYKDYALANKKPEMPITGFEYLEKIVHLPFRLPPLTNREAALFVRKHELLIQPDAEKRWFDAPEPSKEQGDGDGALLHRKGMDREAQLDLLPLVLSSFDHFVPRKLIRLVELMKQLTEVTNAPDRKPIDRRFGGEIDPRIVIALVLLQLFSPEAYRFLRRRPEAFSTLLSSFDAKAKRQLGHHVSDADLCDWVVPPQAKRARSQAAPPNERGLRGLMDRLSGDISLQWSDSRERASAQNVRLPLVALLLEHRALTRNVFDPIKLFQVLASDLRHTGQNPAAVVLRPYLRMLTEKAVRRAVDERPFRHRVHQVEALFDDMVFDDEPARNNLLARHDIPEDACLTRQTSDELAAAARAYFDFSKQSENEVEQAAQSIGKKPYEESARDNFLHALTKLDEAVAQDDRAPWGDVLSQFEERFEEISTEEPLENPAAAAHYWNLKSRWGFDERFEKASPGLPAQPWPHHEDVKREEPILGFVRVEADSSFVLGSELDGDDNPLSQATLKDTFYMARYLTTVGQYAHFVQDKGYENETYWDSQGGHGKTCNGPQRPTILIFASGWMAAHKNSAPSPEIGMPNCAPPANPFGA